MASSQPNDDEVDIFRDEMTSFIRKYHLYGHATSVTDLLAKETPAEPSSVRNKIEQDSYFDELEFLIQHGDSLWLSIVHGNEEPTAEPTEVVDYLSGEERLPFDKQSQKLESVHDLTTIKHILGDPVEAFDLPDISELHVTIP